MKFFKKKNIAVLLVTMIAMCIMPIVVFATDGEAALPNCYSTFWALVPPLVAIALALITKEVYSSLFIGILLGGALYIFAEPLLKIYISDKEAIAAGVLRITIVYLTHSLYGWTDVLAAALRGMGRSALSMAITMSGLCGFTIVWIYTVYKMSPTLVTLYSVYPVAWVLTTIVDIICITVVIKKIGKKHRI